MPRKKVGKENIRKLQNSNGSYYLSLPIGIVRELGWKERQKVVARKQGKDKILIADWKKQG